ncbi:MAG: hypothetical protein HYV52_01325 [Parcubacteria group bacterium]|nr:hypothetical protein [Parcubacteria group bacterium]
MESLKQSFNRHCEEMEWPKRSLNLKIYAIFFEIASLSARNDKINKKGAL